MFRHGYVPQDWKCAVVVPILRPSKPPGFAGCYRPISLTLCLGKVIERMDNNRFKWHLDHLKILPTAQTGFRRGCNISDNFIGLKSSVMAGFNKNHVT